MRMKYYRISLGAIFTIFMTILTACNPVLPKNSRQKCAQDTMPHNMSSLVDRYYSSMDAVGYQVTEENSELVIDMIGEIILKNYGETNTLSDFTIKDVSTIENPKMESWAELYNSIITMNSIYSLVEVWLRNEDKDNFFDYRWLRDAIKAYKTDTLFNEDAKTAIVQAQKDLDKFFLDISHGDDENLSFPESWYICDSLLNAQFDAIMPQDLLQEVDSIGNATKSDWKNIKTTSQWYHMQYLHNDSVKIEIFLNMLNNASCFDEQCRLALCGGRLIPEYVALPVMSELLQCGKFSRYLYVLWDGWRSLLQTEYFGRSRDSVIADELYNIMRKKVFLTTLHYADQCPNDTMALYNLMKLTITPCIIRNGNYFYGNDANLTVWELFGE